MPSNDDVVVINHIQMESLRVRIVTSSIWPNCLNYNLCLSNGAQQPTIIVSSYLVLIIYLTVYHHSRLLLFPLLERHTQCKDLSYNSI